MGLLDFLDNFKSGPSEKKIASAAKALSTRHGEPVRRYEAADKLAEWAPDWPEAIDGLLSRYLINAEKEMSDEEEKAYVAKLLEKLGAEKVVPAIEHYLRKEAQVGWPLRILEGMVSAEEFKERVTAILSKLDKDFDRYSERKVEMIHSLMEHAGDEQVASTVLDFLEDTDDTVRMAAVELACLNKGEACSSRLVDALLDSRDRPRVMNAIVAGMAAAEMSVAGRKAEIEPLLPKGYYLTRQGGLRRLER